ncbi:MAG: DNA replication/repair protein RecF [Clostridiaceae bacterium]|nr:DNA replication/repair protein RecF [Clostridiaceae bacterium]
MYVTNIRLEQFRNYRDQSIDTGSGVNVFYGNNAQGKTNILEAIYMCACARSHRTSRDQDLIMHENDQYRVSIEYVNDNGSKDELTIQYLDAVSGDPQRQRASRLIFHNSMKVDRISDMMGLFHAVIFAPEDLMLVKEGPSTRRRFLDLLVSQIRPSYFRNLQQYQRQLTQRNKLLKDIRETGLKKTYDDPLMVQLDIWTSSLAQTAASLIEQRVKFSDKIAEYAAESLDNISSGKEKLNVKYKTTSGISINRSKNEIADILYNKLKTIVYDDIARGSTSYGPHRDDLELWLNDEPLKPYASQGQQRSVVLSLKIAELKIIKEEINEYPVLLLDDVMSELDEKRRGCLLANITGAQVFVTCTEAEHVVGELEAACTYIPVKTARSYDFYQVEAGSVIHEDS